MTRKQTLFRMTLRSNPDQIRRVEAFVHKVNHSAHLNEITLHKVLVSLTEAVNNAILHGNRSDGGKKVRIRCELHPEWLVLFVRDEGKGFNPRKVRSPLKKENLLKANGRGIFLMKTLMDKVEFTVGRQGSEVALWLQLHKF